MEKAKLDRWTLGVGLVAVILVALTWVNALVYAPTERHMGEVYRIIYLHVPAAFCAFISAFVLLVSSILTLWRRNPMSALWAQSAAEIGLVFTILTLASGSIWGRPTWGVWWVWDARLTTTLILALLYAGYLIFTSSMSPGPQRDRLAAALGVIIAVDVPIIYKSVTWWRTLHQPPTIMRRGGNTIDGDMANTLYLCTFALILLAGWLLWVRAENLKIRQRIEQLGLAAQHS